MSKLLGFFLIIVGVLIGLYFGLWWAFIGGIIQVVNQIRAPEINVLIFALGIVKVIFAAFIGWVSALTLIIPGVAILTK